MFECQNDPVYDVFVESYTDHKALPPQMTRKWAIHNEIRSRVSHGHVLAKASVELHACEAGRGEHLTIGAKDTVV